MRFSRDYCDFFDFSTASPRRRDLTLADFRHNCALLLRDLGVEPAGQIARQLADKMSSGILHYHTPVHILSIFQWARKNAQTLQWWEQLTLWFHDAVYDPGAVAKENENESAVYLETVLAPHLLDRPLDQVSAAIIVTADHLEANTDPQFDRIMDLDLGSFAWPDPVRAEVAQCIDLEFSGLCGEVEFLTQRKAFLKKLTAKGFIYRSKYFRDKFDALAMRNIEKELALLDQALGDDRV